MDDVIEVENEYWEKACLREEEQEFISVANDPPDGEFNVDEDYVYHKQLVLVVYRRKIQGKCQWSSVADDQKALRSMLQRPPWGA